MVTGNPPRHSKNPDEPVTIDLEAESVDPATEPERPADPASGTATDDLEMRLENGDAPMTEDESSRAGDAREHAAEPQQESREDGTQPASPSPATGTRVSTLIAAGIFGGLVALVGAGAIQYAGYLPGSGSGGNDVTALRSEIDGLRDQVAKLATTPVPDDTSALEKRIAALEAAASQEQPIPAATDSAATEALNEKVAELNDQVAQLKATQDQATAEQASSGADISRRLDEAEKKLNEPRQDVAVARAIAAAALKAAIDRGGPFLAELDTFAAVAPDDPSAAALKNFAATGVPSRAELIRQVPGVATAIVETAQQPAADAGWSERLLASAQSLVKVRPVGNIEGDGVEAIAARMEDKVKNGDLQGASAEWDKLPPAAKSASAAFRQSLEARIRIEDLVGGALSKAVAGTGKQS